MVWASRRLAPLGLLSLLLAATPVSAQCVGDCAGDGDVTIDDLILGVDIALGSASASACPAFANEMGTTDIAQLIKGVSSALSGCETPAATATTTSASTATGGAATPTSTASSPAATTTATAPPTATPTAPPTATPAAPPTATPTAPPTATPTATAPPTVTAPRTIPADDVCNKNGADGSVAEQVGAQIRRSGTEWASTCLATYGSAGPACDIAFPGHTSNPHVPEGVPSLDCPNTRTCDDSLGRVEWHAENKFARKCTLDQWALVWRWIQHRAGAAAPPDCDVTAAAPHFWGVYSCFEEYFVHPLMIDMLDKLRAYATAHPSITPACEGAVITRMWFKLGRDWIRFGHDTCRDIPGDVEVENACNTNRPSPMIDRNTLDAWCDDFTAFLRPVYEGVRAASGKPY